ncbi:MAG: hypothetical protein KF722_04195 [Nitrospira sp.]|nr:hypothetical protein [Nitrospira sp.]
MTKLRLARSGVTVVLGQEIGRGGEGVIFALPESPDRVAKLYLKELEPKKVQKLTMMVGTSTPTLLKIAAWPIDLLIDAYQKLRGFVMPRIAARRDIHELYSPKSRVDAFPQTDFRFLVHVGTNIARAFARVHEHGHVIGDVNHGNLLVGPDGTVMLIDCDSFQVGQGATAFSCDVGVPLFTAPELHGKPLRGLIRTPNHDMFGLAVLLFHLVYMGRHPFAGRFLGHGDMPIEKAVAENRFAYGPDRQANQMERPPGTIPLDTMGRTISDLFIRTFERAGNHGGRPKAEKWIDALVQLENSLRVCSSAKWHHYLQSLPACPWCSVEKKTGVRLFGQRVIVNRFTGTVDIDALWETIVVVPGPGPDPTLPSERPGQLTAVSSVRKIAYVFRKLIGCAIVLLGIAACNADPKGGSGWWGLAALIIAYAIWPRASSEERLQAERVLTTAKNEWEDAIARWKREASQSVFRGKLDDLEKAKRQLVDLPRKRQQGIAKLEGKRHGRQLDRYLDRFRIDRGDIPGIGPSRTAMLASYGIETAADIKRGGIDIPGFGRKLNSELLKWRKGHEQNFRFNPNEPVNQADIDELDRELDAEQVGLSSILRQGPEQLRWLSSDISAARARLMPVLERCWHQLQLAEASLKAL